MQTCIYSVVSYFIGVKVYMFQRTSCCGELRRTQRQTARNMLSIYFPSWALLNIAAYVTNVLKYTDHPSLRSSI